MADEVTHPDPTLRDAHNYSDKAGKKFLHQSDKIHARAEAHATQSHKDEHEKKDKQPAGGFDATPISSAPPGYTIRITFHRAHNLPFADFNSLSSDPYVLATLKTDLRKRHKEDPDLVYRTPTIRRNTSPEWNAAWTIAHVPPSGFTMKMRLYDEDPADHDDRLGNINLHVDSINEEWAGLKEQSYGVKKRMASKRAYLIRGCASLIWRRVTIDAQLIISVECLGRSEGDGGRAYTIGVLPWIRHYSPLIGRLTGTKDRSESENGKEKPERYNFQAIQMQLAGPVPPELYHRYVEFKPFVAGLFTANSLRGWILNRALHHQHNRIYNFDRSTLYGFFPTPSVELTKQFLDFVHYDHGGRIFTYVLTLDAQWRFTETGKEFGIDLLSKHTMHSDVSIYIAFSGEFFIRRLKKPWRRKARPLQSALSKSEQNGEKDRSHGPEPEIDVLLPEAESDSEDDSKPNPRDATSSTDPSYYEMIIDNDSGTYRPNAEYLPMLHDFMERSLPGLRIMTLDCQTDADKMDKMKKEQKEKKRNAKGAVQYLQRDSDSSSISSSDEEDLDELERRNEKKAGREPQQGKVAKVKHSIKMTTSGVKSLIAAPGGGTEGENDEGENGAGGEGCAGKGGIVGENGPVRMRERKEKLKAERKGVLHRRSRDAHAHEPGTENEGEKLGDAKAASNEKDSKGVSDEKAPPNGLPG